GPPGRPGPTRRPGARRHAAAAGLEPRLRAPLAGLVLSSPPFRLRIPAWSRPALTWLARRQPELRVPHGLAPACISHDRAVVAAYL
ncbi:lysophospholipase, partial [Bordetella pertussis]|uniref:lysophospholipase n=1 Tax=Bordetella pertussis TaxID=520 RepID=UPI0021CBE0FE